MGSDIDVNRERTLSVGVRLWVVQINGRQSSWQCTGTSWAWDWWEREENASGKHKSEQLPEAGKEWEGAYTCLFWIASWKTWLHMCLQLSWTENFRLTHLNSAASNKNQEAVEKCKQLYFEDVVIMKWFNFLVILSPVLSTVYNTENTKYTAVDNDSSPIFAFSVSVHICLSL